MRILFMGSGEIAEPTIRKLMMCSDIELVGVVTQPARPKGRGLKMQACPIMRLSDELGLLVLDPEKVGAESSVQELAGLKPDLIVVAAYGQYIHPVILELPPLGAINLHPSLLPKYRGAAPIQMAIANGETETGVTILYVSREMDAGDMILQRTMEIGADDTAADMLPKLAELGGELMVNAIDQIRDGTVTRTPQNADEVLYVSKLSREDGRIDWSRSASEIRNRVRGFFPWPGTFCHLSPDRPERLKIHRVRIEQVTGNPGEVLDVGKEGPLIATGEGAIRLIEVQPPGKKAMSGAAFLNGHALRVGDRMG